MKRLFISAIGGDVGYGIIKALRHGGQKLHIIGCDVRRYNAASDLVDEFYTAPPFRDEERWLRFVTETIRKSQADFFWPVAEAEIKIMDKNRDAFGHLPIVMNSAKILEVALDKGKTARFLRENGILTPSTWEPSEPALTGFPLIVKEKFGCGSHSVVTVHDADGLSRAAGIMESPIIQQYVGSKDEEYTMAVFSDGKVVNHIAFRRTLGLGSMSVSVELVRDDALADIAAMTARIFNLSGSVNIQLRKADGCYYVFEINPRISSTIGFRFRLEFNDAAWWLDMIEGRPVAKYCCPPGEIRGVRSVEEKIFIDGKFTR